LSIQVDSGVPSTDDRQENASAAAESQEHAAAEGSGMLEYAD